MSSQEKSILHKQYNGTTLGWKIAPLILKGFFYEISPEKKISITYSTLGDEDGLALPG